MSPPSPASLPSRPAADRSSSSAVAGGGGGGSWQDDGHLPPHRLHVVQLLHLVRQQRAPPFSQVRLTPPSRPGTARASSHGHALPPHTFRRSRRWGTGPRVLSSPLRARLITFSPGLAPIGPSPGGPPLPTVRASSDAGEVAADADARVRTAGGALHTSWPGGATYRLSDPGDEGNAVDAASRSGWSSPSPPSCTPPCCLPTCQCSSLLACSLWK